MRAASGAAQPSRKGRYCSPAWNASFARFSRYILSSCSARNHVHSVGSGYAYRLPLYPNQTARQRKSNTKPRPTHGVFGSHTYRATRLATRAYCTPPSPHAAHPRGTPSICRYASKVGLRPVTCSASRSRSSSARAAAGATPSKGQTCGQSHMRPGYVASGPPPPPALLPLSLRNAHS